MGHEWPLGLEATDANSEAAVVSAAAAQAFAVWEGDAKTRKLVNDYDAGNHAAPYTPKEANREYRKLAERSKTNWIRPIVNQMVQSLYVDGYRQRNATGNANPWSHWQANGLDRRQHAIHREGIKHGKAFVVCEPGTPDPVPEGTPKSTTPPIPSIRGFSTDQMVALYANAAEDNYPQYSAAFEKVGKDWQVRLWSATHKYLLAGRKPSELAVVSSELHGVGVCPTVQFTFDMDLAGNVRGEVLPYIDQQDRVNQTGFDLLMVQTFASFKVRTVSGMIEPSDAGASKMQMAQDRLLVAEDVDTKFGVLAETPLAGFIDALDNSVRQLAATSQTPPQHLLGQMANLSAEALAAAEKSNMRKSDLIKSEFGESWEQVLRLSSAMVGDSEGAFDYESEVQWRDVGSRSFASVVDGLVKIRSGLDVPAQELWELIPGVTRQQAQAWAAAMPEDPMLALETEIARALTSADDGGA